MTTGERRVPQSLSSPNLVGGRKRGVVPLRRTQSFFGLRSGSLEGPKVRSRCFSSGSGWPASLLKEASLDSGVVPQVDGAESPRSDGTETTLRPGLANVPIEAEKEDGCLGGGESEGMHLHTMDIHQQLRSMSALSDDTTEDDALLMPHHTWNFHHRERRRVNDPSAFSRHTHVRSTTNPQDLRRGLSPAASSVYSRPSSLVSRDAEQKDGPSYEIPNVDGALMDWPLQPPATNASVRESQEGSEHEGVVSEERASTPLTASRSTVRHSGTANSHADQSSVRFTPRPRTAPLQSKASSSLLTGSSRRSRFLQRLSPPKKTVKKRRSIFKFLRAGTRKQQQQIRSISSPILRPTLSPGAGLYDGPADDPGLLTVQYELTNNPQHSGKFASVSHLSSERKGTATRLSVPSELQRRPSLAEYERHLTATGDDRRRPSTIDLQKLEEVQEDDRCESLLLQRKLSRAKPLADEPTGLMAQALEKHQQEKALFRSASKQRESLHARPPTPQTRPVAETFVASGANLAPPSIAVHDEAVDPAEKPGRRLSTAGKEAAAGHLVPPEASAAGPSGYASTAASLTTTESRRLSSAPLPPDTSLSSPDHQKRIGTALESWSRFPSHSRPERSGSAGPKDAVFTKDFAIDMTTAELEALEEGVEAGSPPTSKGASLRGRRLPRSRSTMFSGLARYYSNIFSSDSAAGQNRRTSVVKGGWLANPDLELLPAPNSSEPTFPHQDHGFKQHLHQLEHELEETVRRDVEFVEAEAQKFSKEVRREVGIVEEEAERFEREFERDVQLVEDGAERFENRLRKDLELVEEEAEKFMHHNHQHQHHQHHHQSAARSAVGGNMFKQEGLFADQPHVKRDSTFMGPLDNLKDEPATGEPNVEEHSATLDGTTEPTIQQVKKPYNKAEVFSDLYKDCLVRPDSASSARAATNLSTAADDLAPNASEAAPSALKPVKVRSPEQRKQLDAQSSVRRFPSVTVVDDRKGHSRSVSLLSVKVGADGGIYRSSTNDLLQLLQEREREERERLLSGGGSGI